MTHVGSACQRTGVRKLAGRTVPRGVLDTGHYGNLVEISLLTEADRADWEITARSFKAYFGVETSDEAYEQTWRRLIEGRDPRNRRAD